MTNYIKYDATSILKIIKNFIAKNITSARVWTWNLSAFLGRVSYLIW